MKTTMNLKLKTLLAAMLAVSAAASSAGEYKYYSSQSGSGNTKADALASAIQHLPYGAKIEKIGFNGRSTKECVKGVGYVQTSGSYKCKIEYSK